MRKGNSSRNVIRSLVGISLYAFIAQGCDDGASTNAPDLNCHPATQGIDCFFPFPSDWARSHGDGQPSIAYSDESLPLMRGTPLNFTTNYLDGFPVHPPIFATLGVPLSDEGLTFHDEDTSATLSATSQTLVIDTSTGEAVAHFAELDATQKANAQTLLQIRLLSGLKPNTRYVVAVQGLKTTEGELAPRPSSFDAIVQNKTHAAHADVAEHYHQSILPILTTYGVDLNAVQLAWDFTTRSDQSARGDLNAMLDQTRTWLDGLDDLSEHFTVEEITLNDVNHVAEEHVIRFSVPLFLKDTEPGARITRAADGTPTYTQTAEVEAIARIPQNLHENDAAPRAYIQFGHGFFGSNDEIRGGFIPEFADENDYVFVATNWWGLSSNDLSTVLTAVGSKPETIYDITDRTLQAMVNQYVLSAVLKTLAEPVDAEVHFYGASLGHILGSTAVAVNPNFDRAIFSVGGGSFSFIMSRSSAFAPLLQIMGIGLKGPHATQKFFALSSLQLERIDPMTWANELLETEIAGDTIQRQILAQGGLGDPAVPILSFLMWAREAGIPIADSSAVKPSGDPIATLPTSNSAAVVFDFQTGETPLPGWYSNIVMSSNIVHGGPRSSDVGQQQVSLFLDTGAIENFCDGTCNPD